MHGKRLLTYFSRSCQVADLTVRFRRRWLALVPSSSLIVGLAGISSRLPSSLGVREPIVPAVPLALCIPVSGSEL